MRDVWRTDRAPHSQVKVCYRCDDLAPAMTLFGLDDHCSLGQLRKLETAQSLTANSWGSATNHVGQRYFPRQYGLRQIEKGSGAYLAIGGSNGYLLARVLLCDVQKQVFALPVVALKILASFTCGGGVWTENELFPTRRGCLRGMFC